MTTADVVARVMAQRPSLDDDQLAALRKIGYEGDGSDLTVEMVVQMKLAAMAMSGDLNAAKLLYDHAKRPRGSPFGKGGANEA